MVLAALLSDWRWWSLVFGGRVGGGGLACLTALLEVVVFAVLAVVLTVVVFAVWRSGWR